MDVDTVRLTAWVRGRVQGVGFRWWVAGEGAGARAWPAAASNLRDGRVEVVAEGPRAGVRAAARAAARPRDAGTVSRVSGALERAAWRRGPGFIER